MSPSCRRGESSKPLTTSSRIKGNTRARVVIPQICPASVIEPARHPASVPCMPSRTRVLLRAEGGLPMITITVPTPPSTPRPMEKKRRRRHLPNQVEHRIYHDDNGSTFPQHRRSVPVSANGEFFQGDSRRRSFSLGPRSLSFYDRVNERIQALNNSDDLCDLALRPRPLHYRRALGEFLIPGSKRSHDDLGPGFLNPIETAVDRVAADAQVDADYDIVDISDDESSQFESDEEGSPAQREFAVSPHTDNLPVETHITRDNTQSMQRTKSQTSTRTGSFAGTGFNGTIEPSIVHRPPWRRFRMVHAIQGRHHWSYILEDPNSCASAHAPSSAPTHLPNTVQSTCSQDSGCVTQTHARDAAASIAHFNCTAGSSTLPLAPESTVRSKLQDFLSHILPTKRKAASPQVATDFVQGQSSQSALPATQPHISFASAPSAGPGGRSQDEFEEWESQRRKKRRMHEP